MGFTTDGELEDPPAPAPIPLPNDAPAWAQVMAFRLGLLEQNTRYIPNMRVQLGEIKRAASRRTIIFTVLLTAVTTAMAAGIVTLLLGLRAHG